MAQTDTVFSGSIARLYDQNMVPFFFDPYAHDLVRRLASLTAGRVLETAAGTGAVTRAMIAALPASVELVMTDLNQPMLDLAMTKPGMERVQARQADALALSFPDQAFDAVVCQFGIMFFPDRVAGMREAYRVLKPGGRFLFNVWGPIADVAMNDVVVAALKQRYPSHPSWFLERTPSGYHDPGLIRRDLAAAGFATAAIERVALTGRAPDARAPVVGLCQGTPLAAEIESVDPGGLGAATEAVMAAAIHRFGPGPIEAPMVALVVETVRT